MHDFSNLSPDLILDAIEHLGFRCDARILELNSYENRVFQIGIEDQLPIIAKFYRPNRWTRDMIEEEHGFSAELFDHGVSVVPPISQGDESLLHPPRRCADRDAMNGASQETAAQ